MTDRFFEQSILNSPCMEPVKHWEPDGSGQSTGDVFLVQARRKWWVVQPSVELDE